MPHETRDLAEFLSNIRFEDLPVEVVNKAKECILDQLGVQLVASSLPWAGGVYRALRDTAGKSESTTTKFGTRLDAGSTAFMNGTLGHGCEFDDLGPRFGHGHPGCVVIPSAIAIAERHRMGGKDLIQAVVAGYEVQGRISLSCSRSILRRGFHNPWFVFGPTVAAGSLMGFDTAKMVNALGIAGSFAAGLRQYTKSGGETKRLHAGAACRNGILSADLAEGGFDAPPDILEGETGFIAAFADTYSFEPLTHGLGADPLLILETGHKLVPCCGGIMATLQTVQRIVDGCGVRVSDIRAIRVRLGATRIDQVGKTYIPRSLLGAQFSLPFTLGLAFVKERLDLPAFANEEFWTDPDITNFTERIEMLPDVEAEAPYEKHRKGIDHRSSGSVTVVLNDGSELAAENKAVTGFPGSPIGWDELRAKFEMNVADVLEQTRTEAVIDMIEALEELDNIGDLTAHMSPG